MMIRRYLFHNKLFFFYFFYFLAPTKLECFKVILCRAFPWSLTQESIAADKLVVKDATADFSLPFPKERVVPVPLITATRVTLSVHCNLIAPHMVCNFHHPVRFDFVLIGVL